MTNLKLTVALVGSCLLITAQAASADVVYHYHYAYQWQINRVSAPYQTQTGWHFCAQSHGGTVTCSRAFTVANSVTGQIGVSDGVLPATLGFNVTKSTTTTGGATYKVPRRRLGVAEWRSLSPPRLSTSAATGETAHSSAASAPGSPETTTRRPTPAATPDRTSAK